MTHAGQDAALRVLVSDPECLEPGLVALDSQLRLDERASVDLLARDGLGYPVIVLFCGDDPSVVLGRMAAAVTAIQKGRHLIGRLYADRGLDAALRPRFFLLSRRFPDHAPALFDLMASVEVRALEYRVVRDAEGHNQLEVETFHRTGRPGRRASPDAGTMAPVMPASPPDDDGVVEPPPDDLELLNDVEAPADSKRLFLRARDSIRSLSGQVTESSGRGRMSFLVEDVLLASLELDGPAVRLRVGTDDGDEHAVADEDSFNRGLNAVFNHYFNRLASGD